MNSRQIVLDSTQSTVDLRIFGFILTCIVILYGFFKNLCNFAACFSGYAHTSRPGQIVGHKFNGLKNKCQRKKKGSRLKYKMGLY